MVKTIQIPGVLAPVLGLIFLAVFLIAFVAVSGYLMIAFVVLCCGALASSVISWGYNKLRRSTRKL